MKLSKITFLLLFVFFDILLLGGPILIANGSGGFIEITNPLKQSDPIAVICAIVKLLQTIALPLAIVMVVWGGIQIMTAAGSEERVTSGKKTIMWTVIGYAIVFLVRFIIGFVAEMLGGPGSQVCQ